MLSFLKRILTWPVFIVCVAFLLRVLLLAHNWRVSPAPVIADLPYGFELGRVARAIAAGEGFSSPLRMVDSGPTVWFTPIYPYLVAGIFKIWGIFSDPSLIVIQILNCAFAALTIIPIFYAAQRTFGTGVAVAASWIWTVFPKALFFPTTWVWDTSLTALCLALLLWATLSMRGERGMLRWAGYGALWAFGVLVNPSLLSIFPFLLAWLLWDAHKQGEAWIRFAGAALLVFALGMVPWTVRNYVVFHKVIVLRSNFGLELWLGNNSQVADNWAPWMHPNDNPEEARKYKQMGEIAYMAEKEHEAFAFMRSHPADAGNFLLHRFVNHWLDITDSPADTWAISPWYVRCNLVLNASLSVFCLMGAFFASRARNPEALPYAIVILIFPLVFYATHTSLRYRFPMDSVMIILSTAAVGHLISVARGWWFQTRETSTAVATHSGS